MGSIARQFVEVVESHRGAAHGGTLSVGSYDPKVQRALWGPGESFRRRADG
jgi:hypothetical protein